MKTIRSVGARDTAAAFGDHGDHHNGVNMMALLQVFLILVTLTAVPSIAMEFKVEEAEIRMLAERWELAWNKHDMQALAALFTHDADFVNVGARHWKGNREIETQHAARLDQFRESVWTTKEVTVQFLKPDVALVHVVWALRGDKDPDGTRREPREGVFTWIAVAERGRWLIRAAQNTNQGNLRAPTLTK